VSHPTTQAIDTLRRCIGALVAAEERAREDMASMLALEGTADTPATPEQLFAAERIEYKMRADLADLCALAIAEARQTSQALQADAIAMAALRGPVDAFFTAVMVNSDVAEERENRLKLLVQVRGGMNRVADFGQIAG
jgi:glycyl-tRNA synthetase beta subunit